MSINHFEGNTMKNTFATTALIVAAALSAGSVFAADSASRTRADVRAEVLAARANGTFPAFSDAEPRFQANESGKRTRAAVQAEYFQARKDGTLLPLVDSAFAPAQSASSALTRAAVKADYLKAQKDGTLPSISDRV